jgi:hypothetical protein
LESDAVHSKRGDKLKDLLTCWTRAAQARTGGSRSGSTVVGSLTRAAADASEVQPRLPSAARATAGSTAYRAGDEHDDDDGDMDEDDYDEERCDCYKCILDYLGPYITKYGYPKYRYRDEDDEELDEDEDEEEAEMNTDEEDEDSENAYAVASVYARGYGYRRNAEGIPAAATDSGATEVDNLLKRDAAVTGEEVGSCWSHVACTEAQRMVAVLDVQLAQADESREHTG